MQDHDQRFKHLIKEFFAAFLQLFFAPWAERLDCSKAEWLEKEVFHDPPDGTRSVLDLLAKLPAKDPIPGFVPAAGGDWLALIHIEIESPDGVASLRPYMFESYVALRKAYRLPVLLIGLYLKVGLNGIGVEVYEEYFWDLQPIRFQYLYVGLPGLEAINYIEGDNWLGVALSALMKMPAEQAAWFGVEALRRIKDAPLTDQQRFLLSECVQAYLPLDESQALEMERLCLTEKYIGVKAMNKTWYEKGVERGFESGQRELLRKQIEQRFGAPLSAGQQVRLTQMTPAELSNLGSAILHAKSMRQLGFDE